MIWIWLASAQAASVICDPVEAARIVVDARIDERRAPVTHPTLVPGLARGAASSSPQLAAAIDALCTAGDATVERGDRYVGPGWAAHTVLLASRRQEGCELVVERIAIDIGIDGDAVQYALRGGLPQARSPLGECDQPAIFRDEHVLDGAGAAVRLVRVSDHGPDGATHHLVVRTAAPTGWTEQLLMDPAPPRVVDGTAGPRVHLVWGPDDTWVVAHDDRTETPCRPVPGQTVWTPQPDATWRPHTGREALHLLAERGAWRAAGEPAWFLILALDDAQDLRMLESRRSRLAQRDPEPLYNWASDDFPLLQPGYVFVAPAPWASEASAQAARGPWKRRRAAYVKEAWSAPTPCDSP